MATGSYGRRLVACLLNVSEGCRKDVVEKVAKAALYSCEGIRQEGTTVLNIFNDHDYNRSVITIVSGIDSIREVVLSACEEAFGLIDMHAHTGIHPCMGAVDLIPIYPLGQEVGVEDCAQEARGCHQDPCSWHVQLEGNRGADSGPGGEIISLAWERLAIPQSELVDVARKGKLVVPCWNRCSHNPTLDKWLWMDGWITGNQKAYNIIYQVKNPFEEVAVALGLTERVQGTSAFLFGWADSPLQRGLAQRRKEMGWFKKTPDLKAVRPDVGLQMQKRFGLTGVGASPYVMNCNVTIDTQDITVGRSIAAAIRESTPGGLPGLQVLALPHEGAVEIACNVESVRGRPPSHLTTGEPWPSFSIDGQPYCHAPGSLVTAKVEELAARQGVSTKGTALVGFTPRECRGLAELALAQGISEFWKEQRRIHM